jgi:hypothetical protein
MATSRGAQGLIVVALAGVVAFAAWYGQAAWEDSGSFAFVLFGVPLVCAVVALATERATGTRIAPVVVAGVGLVSLAWSLVTAGGIGIGFAPSSLLLLVAALVSWTDRRDSSRPVRT